MRAFWPILLLLVVSPVAAIATANTAWQSLARTPQVTAEMESGDARMLDSLREDVARHPDDFVSFQTQTAALRFIDEHGFEANRETARRMIDRGVLGYWRGKMVVVVPIVWRRACMFKGGAKSKPLTRTWGNSGFPPPVRSERPLVGITGDKFPDEGAK